MHFVDVPHLRGAVIQLALVPILPPYQSGGQTTIPWLCALAPSLNQATFWERSVCSNSNSRCCWQCWVESNFCDSIQRTPFHTCKMGAIACLQNNFRVFCRVTFLRAQTMGLPLRFAGWETPRNVLAFPWGKKHSYGHLTRCRYLLFSNTASLARHVRSHRNWQFVKACICHYAFYFGCDWVLSFFAVRFSVVQSNHENLVCLIFIELKGPMFRDVPFDFIHESFHLFSFRTNCYRTYM